MDVPCQDMMDVVCEGVCVVGQEVGYEVWCFVIEKVQEVLVGVVVRLLWLRYKLCLLA